MEHALTLGLGWQVADWELDLAYSSFNGAGHQNLIRDRDFVALSASVSF